MTSHPRISCVAVFSTIVWVCLSLLLVLSLAPAQGQSGLSSRSPMGAFLNGKFPSTTPGTAYTAQDVFPALRFENPIDLVQRPYSPEIWVICQGGTLWCFDKLNPTAKLLVLDLSDVTVDQNEGDGDSGLLGLAFHPEFGQAGKPGRGYIYLYYSYRPAGETYGPYSYNRLSRFTLADGASTIARCSELVLINQFDRKTWHNGGDLFFDNEGFLYISNGDEGDGIPGAEFSNSQKINDGLFSGVLRIDVDMIPTRSHPIRRQPRSPAAPPAGWPASYTQNYHIPNDNPWVNADGSTLEEFYAIGLRSPHRMGYDRVTEKAVIADTGHDVMEEVDVLASGANYQWPYMEGTATGPQTYRRGPGVETAPIHTYSARVRDGSISIGGEVYRGADHTANLGGKYVFGDFMTGNVWALGWLEPGAPRRHLLTVPAGTDYRGLAGFGTDAEGEV
jgi:glucose/arabinose dehydrogenase